MDYNLEDYTDMQHVLGRGDDSTAEAVRVYHNNVGIFVCQIGHFYQATEDHEKLNHANHVRRLGLYCTSKSKC